MKIIKHGREYQKKFKTECEKCGCVFLYNVTDVTQCAKKYNAIGCPECNNIIWLRGMNNDNR